MAGFLRATAVLMRRESGLLWKVPWRMSQCRKERQRERLSGVDSVIRAVRESGVSSSSLVRALEMPTQSDMPSADKYTVFARSTQKKKSPKLRAFPFRKGIHRVPKWTRITVTERRNPAGF